MAKTKKADLARQVLEYKLDDSVGFMITITERRLKKHLTEALAYEGFPYGMWFFLRVLFEEDGLTQKELSNRVGMTQPTTVKALRDMEEYGFVRIEKDAEDRRRMRIFLTDKGRKVGARILPILKELNRFALKGVTKEQLEVLRQILRKVRQNIDNGRFVPRLVDEEE
ncbi:MAG: winged helix DNA-binding protein [Pigmentiphaga sp.]|uniref:MarR family winged helix-turn-helix transcriptional regulator n=1 Tax=Pigmentiphaga sp. TaxID=1977564 RepID=UPI0029AF3219|nr:MarR family transcriptional regulator [Pigmentiphaga sp.]MDX3904657.1 winged helix DNA-binding protein [Pigmentiphaga sp.]